MRCGRLIPGLILWLLILVSCGRPDSRLAPLEFGRFDFIADDRLVDVRTEAVVHGRSLDGFQFLGGWVRSGSGGKWAVGSSAEIEFFAPAATKLLWIDCRPYHQLEGRQVVTVVADGSVAGEFRPEPGFNWYAIELPRSDSAGIRHVEFRFEKVRAVDHTAVAGDTRPLALMVRRLALTDGAKPLGKLARVPAVIRTPRGLRIKKPGRLYLNFRSDFKLEKVGVGLRIGDQTGAPVPLTLIRPGTGERLDHQEFETQSGQLNRAWLQAGDHSGAFQLIIDVGEQGLVIDGLQARVLSGSVAEDQVPATETKTKISRPDIVVIVLDAARADHSGSTYGYSRDTMPHVDAFAADAVVFDRVFAEAPYTTCSVPTMFTGLSWRSHGVVKGQDRLPEGEETLAESLQMAGYRTIGITATPNNSKRLGMNQGFDEFEQLWEIDDWRRSIDPMVAADRLQSRLQQGLHETPLFLMLHLVPPHEPYTPPDEFRLWSDPMYDGPCDGTDKYLKSARRKRPVASAADRAQIVALYDGNLRFSDAAVGRILQALRDAGRLDEAVVVITADHGEAFFEHGHLGHNSSIYDEMLRVPLIVRLPGGGGVKDVDLNRLASLEDLTPTLLRLAGVAPSSRISGVDLFSDQQRSGLTIRTTESQGMVGFRSGRWKLIAGGGGAFVELYNLETDSGERSNVLLKHPEKVSWLADQWDRAEAKLPPVLDAEDVGDVGMTDSERAMLQELGYID